MKTAIQELLEKFGHLLPDLESEYLEKEKQQIIEAVKYGFADAHKPNSDINFIHYYEKTFNTTNK